MSAGTWARKSHRWVSIVFTLTVIANFVAMGLGANPPPPWIAYSPLLPLFFQIITGLYLFALPYLQRPARDGAANSPRT